MNSHFSNASNIMRVYIQGGHSPRGSMLTSLNLWTTTYKDHWRAFSFYLKAQAEICIGNSSTWVTLIITAWLTDRAGSFCDNSRQRTLGSFWRGWNDLNVLDKMSFLWEHHAEHRQFALFRLELGEDSSNWIFWLGRWQIQQLAITAVTEVLAVLGQCFTVLPRYPPPFCTTNQWGIWAKEIKSVYQNHSSKVLILWAKNFGNDQSKKIKPPRKG